MAFVPAQSLFEPQGNSAIANAAAWISGTLLGSLAIGLCVIAVATIGLITLTGRLPVRRGMRVVLGCFVLLGAPTIAAAFCALWSEAAPPVPPPILETSPESARADLPPADYDPYAGASLRQD